MMVACKEGKIQVVRAILDDLKVVPEKVSLLKKLYEEKDSTEKEKNMNCLELAIIGGYQ